MGREPYRSDPRGLASLLAQTEPASALWGDADLAALLRHQLATTVAGDVGTFGQILTGTRGGLGDLERVKDFAKSARDDAEGGIPAAVCHVLYYAALAAARLRYGARLTSLADAELARGFDWAVSLPWLDQPLRDLISNGAKAKLR